MLHHNRNPHSLFRASSAFCWVEVSTPQTTTPVSGCPVHTDGRGPRPGANGVQGTTPQSCMVGLGGAVDGTINQVSATPRSGFQALAKAAHPALLSPAPPELHPGLCGGSGSKQHCTANPRQFCGRQAPDPALTPSGPPWHPCLGSTYEGTR